MQIADYLLQSENGVNVEVVWVKGRHYMSRQDGREGQMAGKIYLLLAGVIRGRPIFHARSFLRLTIPRRRVAIYCLKGLSGAFVVSRYRASSAMPMRTGAVLMICLLRSKDFRSHR
jgi:hypothetical protein